MTKLFDVVDDSVVEPVRSTPDLFVILGLAVLVVAIVVVVLLVLRKRRKGKKE